MYDVMIIDDERPAIEQMQDLLADTLSIRRLRTFINAVEAMKSVTDEGAPDLLFLDMEMPEWNGLKVAEYISGTNPQCKIVFVTAYSQYALPAFEWHALDYLLKPVRPERFAKTLQRFRLFAEQTQTQTQTQELAHSTTIICFGHFIVQGQGGRVNWRTKKAEEMFAYLLVNRTPSLAQMLEDMFPEQTSDKATWHAHTSLYRLRMSIKDAGLERQIQVIYKNRQYQLLLADVELDMDRFMRSEDWREALTLYKDQLFQPLDALWIRVVEATCQNHLKRLLQQAQTEARRTNQQTLLDELQQMTIHLDWL